MVFKSIKDHIFIILASVTCIMSWVFMPIRIFNGDALWHIKAGESILSSGSIPFADQFSWSAPGAPWISHEWLFELLIALVYKAGPIGISLFSAFMLIIVLYIYWKLIKSTSSSSMVAAIFYFFTLLMVSSAWTARPYIASYAFLAITLYIILVSKEKPAKLWYFPLVFLVWANFHASVIMGLGILALELLLSFLPKFETENIKNIPGDKKHLAGVLIASAAASLINPHGIKIWYFAYKLSTDPIYKHINEWQAPETLAYKLMIFLILTLAIVFLAIRKNKTDLFLLIVGLLSLFGALSSVRHFYYFVMVWMVVLVQLVGKLEISRKTISLLGAALSLVFIMSFLKNGWVGDNTRVLAEKAGYPVKAVDWLEDNNADRIFNRYNWGGYLIHRGIPVFIDGRADMYHMSEMENDPFLDYNDLINYVLPPEEILQKYDARYFLFPSDSSQVYYLKKCGWEVVYYDEKATILAKYDYISNGEENDKDGE